MYDFNALSDTQISFRKGIIKHPQQLKFKLTLAPKGEFINITKKGKENDWWEGRVGSNKQSGLFPSNYVQLLPSNDTSISQPSQVNTPSGNATSVNTSQVTTSIKENAISQPQQEQPQQIAALDERVNSSLHKLNGKQRYAFSFVISWV